MNLTINELKVIIETGIDPDSLACKQIIGLLNTTQLKHEVLDTRYTFTLEWLGVATKQYAVRFCGEFITSAATYKEAYIKACLYEANRLDITL